MSDQDDRQVFGGRYELQRHIARGGMADVYLARDVMLDRPVALKVLFSELNRDRSFVERFRREAQRAANLSHPNIVSVFDYGEEEGYSFIVMEFVDGRPLSQLIRAEGPLEPEHASEIASFVADALGFAHRNGVVHRDVKPGNVLIDSNGRVKVADFGIARASDADENLTQTGAVMGTATYISPEQATGDRVDPRSDVYSLGVVLFEMVVGRPPFQADSTMAIALKHVNEQPRAPREINADVPEALEAIILQALAKNPDDRYASAEDMRGDLMRFQQGRPVLAVPPGGVAGAALDEPTAAQATVALGRAPQGTQMMERSSATEVEEVHDDEPSKTAPYVILLLVLLAVLGLLLYMLARSVGFGGGGSTGTVEVPELMNKSVEEAIQLLDDAGLEHARTDVASDSPAGTVVAQNPPAGQEVDEGSTVSLTVSAGPEPVPIPDVRGMTIEDALEALQTAGFEDIRQQSVNDSDVPPERVVNTEPPVGTPQATNSQITLLVSSGADTVRVPNVVGQTSADAVDRLEAEGFEAILEREPSGSVPEGRVIRTDPAPGEDAPEGSEVTVFVSEGPDQVEVPNVIGMSEASARTELSEAGLRVSVQYVTADNPGEAGTVVDQDPDGGEDAARNSTVVIRVARILPSSTTTTTDSPPTTTTTTTTVVTPGNRP